MKIKNPIKCFEVNMKHATELKEDEMKKVFGSGNSQVRYIPDEFLQAKIIKERIKNIL